MQSEQINLVVNSNGRWSILKGNTIFWEKETKKKKNDAGYQHVFLFLKGFQKPFATKS